MLAKSINQYAAINWASPLNRGLLRWWLWLPNRSGGKVWRDLTGKVPATMTGAVGVGALGRPGGHGSWHFDGVDDVASTASDDLSSYNTMTLSMWHRVTAFNNNGDIAFIRGSNYDQTGSFYFQPDGGSGSYGVAVRTAVNYNSVAFTRPAAGTWYHILATADRTAGAQQVTAVYINGRSQSLTQVDTQAGNTGGFGTGVWRFGSASASLYAPGQLDSCRCWNRQLSAAEARDVYHDERRGYPRSLRWVRGAVFGRYVAAAVPTTGGALASLCDWDWGNNMSIDTYHNVITGALEAIGSTALQLSASTRKLYKGVTIVANSSNAQTVWLGTSTVTPGTVAATDGLPLTAGQSVALPVDMLSRVYVVAASGSNKVHFLAS